MIRSIRMALFLALLIPAGTVNASSWQVQLCWAAGIFDETMYFAQAEVEVDRKASFDELLSISGIDHHQAECVIEAAGDQRLQKLRSQWSEKKLEVVDTTFLSNLDY